MRNQQITSLALALADLSDIGHLNSSMSFINMSGRNYVNVTIANNHYTIHGDHVKVFQPPKVIPFEMFMSELVSVAGETEVQDETR